MSDNNNSPDAEHMDREARRAARQAERKKKREEARSNRSSARKRQRKRAQKKAEKQAVNRDQSEAQRKAEAALAELAEPIKLPVVDEGNSWRRLKYWFNWQAMLASFVVLLPTLLFAIYQIWFATPRYIAEAKYTVRSVGFSPAPSLAQSLLSGVSSAQTEMAEQIMAFTKSAEMLRRLDARMDFTNKLMGEEIDWWTRLPADALIEEKVEYYQGYVELEYEERSSILTIRTHAFTPNDSVEMLAEIKEEAQKLVTRISNRLSEVQAEKVREQVRNTRKEYIDLQDQMTTLQDKLKSLDPQGEALAAASRIASLEQSLTIQKTELNRLLATMAPGSSAVRQVQNQIAAINEQIRDERAAITGKKNDALNKVASDFRKLALEAQLAEQAYAMTLSAAGTAGVEAASDIKVFVEVVPPSLPEEALEPRVVFNIFTFFGFAVIAYMVIIIMVMVAREHID